MNSHTNSALLTADRFGRKPSLLLARAVPIPVLFLIAAAVSVAAALGVFLLERSGSGRCTT